MPLFLAFVFLTFVFRTVLFSLAVFLPFFSTFSESGTASSAPWDVGPAGGKHVIPARAGIQPHVFQGTQILLPFPVGGELVDDRIPSLQQAFVVLVIQALRRHAVLPQHPADPVRTEGAEPPVMGSHEYIPVGGEQQPLCEQAGTMLIAGHPVYHPSDTVQPFGKVTRPGMQRDAPQLFQREVDTADDRPFPVRCQVRAVLPEVVAENPQRVSGAEEQPDTFSGCRFLEIGRAPADDVEAVSVHELP
jgi:hypothetical protein